MEVARIGLTNCPIWHIALAGHGNSDGAHPNSHHKFEYTPPPTQLADFVFAKKLRSSYLEEVGAHILR